MKKLLLVAGIILLVATSCNKEKDVNDILVPVTVHVNDFSISMEKFSSTRTDPQTPAEYAGIKAFTLAFYTSNNTEQYKVTQLRADESTYTTFGDFSLSLPFGSYTMVVLGYGLSTGESAITLTSPTAATFGDNPARETFVATQIVNITNTDALTLSATLDRVISKLTVVSSDNRTSNASKVRITFSAGGKSFNPSTGLATSNTGFSNTVNIGANVGEWTTTASYLFLASDVQTMNVTIETLDASDNTIFSKVVNNVPLKRNRVTKLTGAIYSNPGVTTSFQMNTDWLTEEDVTF